MFNCFFLDIYDNRNYDYYANRMFVPKLIKSVPRYQQMKITNNNMDID